MGDRNIIEEMIVSKMAEIQFNTIRSEGITKIDTLRKISSIEVNVDTSGLCHQFDFEAINDRKTPEERIKEIRELLIQKIRQVSLLQDDDKKLESECRDLIKLKRQMLFDISSLRKEKQSVDEVKSKIQEICRLLQKQNRDIAEENQRTSAIERERIDELNSKFGTTIIEIENKLSDHENEQLKQTEENNDLKQKLEQFQNHFNLKGEHYETQIKAKTLESQLLDAKYDQALNMTEHEKTKAAASALHLEKMKETEKELKSQIALYSSKFKDFEEAMQKSNDLYNHFRNKIDKLTSSIKKLEKNKIRLEKSMTRHKSETEEELLKTKNTTMKIEEIKEMKTALENQCRELQQQRVEVIKTYNEKKSIYDRNHPPQVTEEGKDDKIATGGKDSEISREEGGVQVDQSSSEVEGDSSPEPPIIQNNDSSLLG